MTIEPEYVKAHLEFYQNIINRMAANSARIKNWCLMLVVAVLSLEYYALSAQYIPLLLGCPILGCSILDAYYLALERAFRQSHVKFVNVFHKNREQCDYMLFIMKPEGNILKMTIQSLLSPSIALFYGMLLFCTFVVEYFFFA